MCYEPKAINFILILSLPHFMMPVLKQMQSFCKSKSWPPGMIKESTASNCSLVRTSLPSTPGSLLSITMCSWKEPCTVSVPPNQAVTWACGAAVQNLLLLLLIKGHEWYQKIQRSKGLAVNKDIVKFSVCLCQAICLLESSLIILMHAKIAEVRLPGEPRHQLWPAYPPPLSLLGLWRTGWTLSGSLLPLRTTSQAKRGFTGKKRQLYVKQMLWLPSRSNEVFNHTSCRLNQRVWSVKFWARGLVSQQQLAGLGPRYVKGPLHPLLGPVLQSVGSRARSGQF